jgi:hypothetical protein
MHIGAIGPIGIENSSDTEYHEDTSGGRGERPDAFDDLNFVDTSTSNDPISQAVDSAATNNTFYVRLDAGDKIQRFTISSTPYVDLLVVKSGSVVAFFTDINNDNEFQPGELTGLSLSANAVIEMNGVVNGDIVTNLNTGGTKTNVDDFVDMNGLIGPKQGIKQITLGNNPVLGSILSGGDIQSLIGVGSAENVLAGAAANGKTFDFFTVAGGEGTVNFTAAPGVRGASISNAEIGALNDFDINNDPIPGVLAAGAGGAGAAGGSLKNIKITGDNDGFTLLAGRGGDADAGSGRPNGGAGGSITKVLGAGVVDGTLNSDILVKAGDGGIGLTTGRGGAGGKVSDVRLGFEVSGGIVVPSDSLLHDNVRIEGGLGGSGKFGGAGGLISSINIRTSTPDEGGGDVELAIVGGSGGNSVSPGGKTGVGGSVSNIQLSNQTTSADTDLLVQGGDGGNVVPAGGESTGSAGGSVTNVKILGSEIQVIGGAGSSGKTGGAGGSLTNVRVLDADIGGDAILAQSILFSAGRGGDGTGGNGGAGGNMTTMTVDSSDLQTMLVNPGTGANGGNSLGGKGGRGGSVTKLLVNDIDSVISNFGDFVARGGDGGDGDKGGGDGGSFTTLTISGAKNVSTFVTAGSGGDATLLGAGGRGGSISAGQITTEGVVNGSNVVASILGGNGGSGAGANKPGGKGGDVRKVMVSLEGDPSLPEVGDALFAAGDGGNGGSAGIGIPATGAAGSGGSVFDSAAFAALGSTTITAGDAGVIGGKPGSGGSLIGSAAVPIGLRGTINLTATAGNGSFGGAGGSITNLSFGNGDVFGNPLDPTPAGTILIKAGAGSQGPTAAGKGGSITGINGGASSGIDQSLQFFAGDGGGDIRTRVTEVVAGAVATKEVQTLEVVNTSTGTFTLSFGGQTTASIPTRQAGETDSAFADRIEAALNAPTILGPGGVDVVPGTAPQTYKVTFSTFGDKDLINGSSAYTYTGTGKSAAGGSISNITLANGGNDGGLITFEAGDGGHSAVAGSGAAGGSIKTVGINDVSALATLQSFGAGDGGDGLSRGGTGGSVTGIQVFGHDIGVRTGKIYGYSEMGGIFAGLGGLGVKAGVAGSVTDVSADSIASIVAGKGDVPQFADKISNITLNGNNQLLFRNSAFTPGGKFTLSFNGQTTQELPGNATAAQLAAALNSLSNVANAGGITVQTFTGDGGYVVQFGSDQKSTTDSSLSANEIEIALESLPTVQAKGGVTTSDQPDGVHVQFVGGGADVVIPLGATATQFASALNSSGLNAFGTFSVTQKISQGIPGDYTIVYHTRAVGDQNQITGIENIPVGVLQKIQGAIATFATSTTLNGELPLPVTETRSGSDPVNVLETVRGQFSFVSSELTQGNPTLVAEVQQFTLNPINGYSNPQPPVTAPPAQFTLTFNSYQTAPISAQGTDQTIANNIDAQLEALTSVQALSGPTGDKVQVTVSPAGRTFNITFGIGDGDVPATQGSYLIPETQRVDVSTLLSIPNAKFNLTFGTSTTPQLAPTITAAQLDSALEQLTDIQALAGPGGDKVSVAANANTHTFDVTFNSNGDKASLTGITFVPEVQTLDLSSALAVPGSKIRLFFDGPGTFQNETTNPLVTPGATDAQTAINIQTALNNLQSIKDTNGGTGTVQVAALGGGLFSVSFQAFGEQNLIAATGVVSEVQNLDLSAISGISNAEFVLTVKNGLPVLETQQYGVHDSFSSVESRSARLSQLEFPVNVVNGTPAAQERVVLDRDLLLSSFGNTGKIVFTYLNTNSTTTFSRVVVGNANFNTIDSQLDPIIGANAPNDGTDNISVTLNGGSISNPLIRFTSPATGDVPNIGATAFVPETQLLDLSQVVTGTKTILTFAGQDTTPLSANPTPLEVQNALNLLPSIQVYGGVSVGAPDGQGRLPITFGNTFTGQPNATPIDVPFLITGTHEFFEKQTLDINRIFGTGATFVLQANGLTTAPPLDQTATDVQIAAELAPLISDGNPNTTDVTVTQVSTGVFEISFETLRGNQAPIVGIATLGTGMTGRLSISSDAATIQAALNPLTIGGLTVSAPGLVNGLPKAGTFDIRFTDPLDNPNIGVTTYVHEVQTIDVLDNLDQNGNPLPNNGGQFYITSGNENTSLLTPPKTIANPFAPTPAEIADLDAKALAVENALNALTSIQTLGGVDVKPAKHTEVVNGVPTEIYDNTAFEITFLGDGDQNALSGIQPEVMPMVTIHEGTALTPEQQEIHYFPKNQIDTTAFATANIVGGIYDLNEHNANLFHFVNLDGSVDSFGRPTFTLGDRPIDGILMARIFDQATVNFTPEARLTASGFFDNDNLL